MIKNIYFCSCVKDGGIFHYRLNDEKLSFCDKIDLEFPMYMIIRENKAHVILREIDSETHFGGIMCFDIDDNGKLINPSEICSTDGIVPCHLEVTNSGSYAVNYLSGNVVKIGEKIVTHTGSSVHQRQTEPHTHFIAENGGNLYCVDLGIDAVICYDENLKELSRCYVPAGCGARHLAFSDDGKLIYCVNEIISSISVFERNGSEMRLLNTYDALPNFKGQNTAAAIRIYKNRLYISNRGADTISEFEIFGSELKLVKNHSCFGKGPRDFDIVNDMFFCTNEQTNDITILKMVNEELVLVGKIAVANPLCVSH